MYFLPGTFPEILLKTYELCVLPPTSCHILFLLMGTIFYCVEQEHKQCFKYCSTYSGTKFHVNVECFFICKFLLFSRNVLIYSFKIELSFLAVKSYIDSSLISSEIFDGHEIPMIFS